MAGITIQKQKIDAYAYLVSVGEYFIFTRDNAEQKEVPNEYKESVATKIATK